MADIATIFHWPLDQLDQLDLQELAEWSERARVRSGNDED